MDDLSHEARDKYENILCPLTIEEDMDHLGILALQSAPWRDESDPMG